MSYQCFENNIKPKINFKPLSSWKQFFPKLKKMFKGQTKKGCSLDNFYFDQYSEGSEIPQENTMD